ncbi:MAG: AAA family ATPase [Acholeplasmataceae bacterium]|nr:AAA family ATPase [Acholeplasmataceae bacterium]
MIVLVGASASGKTELAKLLYQNYNYHKCVTTTTRLPRIGEKDGIDYHFLTFEQFKNLEKNHQFIEVSSYNDQLYGIQRKDVDIQGVVIVEPNGANTLVEKIGKDAFVVYVEASDQTRKSRMLQRGDSIKQVEERIDFDRNVFILKHFKRIDLKLSNEKEALDQLALFIDKMYKLYMKENKQI